MRILFLFCFYGLIARAAAQTSGICDKSLLWEISHPDLAKRSYVFGTIHLISKDKFFWPDSLLWALDQTRMAVFEIDMIEMANPLLQAAMLPEMLIEDGQTLDDFLNDPVDKALLSKYISGSKLPASIVKRIKPVFVSALIDGSSPMAPTKGNTTSFEKEILTQARKRKMMVDGLESAADQFHMLDQTPYSEQLSDLLATIKYQDSTSTDILAALTDAYVQQDLCGLWQLINPQDTPGFVGDQTYILDQRNLNWIPVMQRMINRRPTFFSVGAAHLPGPLGVLNLLQQAGYTVRPVAPQH
jgi:uncharacterized protein YbaP (TraB family)